MPRTILLITASESRHFWTHYVKKFLRVGSNFWWWRNRNLKSSTLSGNTEFIYPGAICRDYLKNSIFSQISPHRPLSSTLPRTPPRTWSCNDDIFTGANFELVKTKLGYLHLPGFPINKRKELSVDTKGQHSNAVYCLIRKWRVTATTMKTFHSMTIPIPSKRRKTVCK